MRRILAGCLAGMAMALLATPGHPTEPPARVGRLAALSGPVSFHPQDAGSWEQAVPNYPVTDGAAFWTEPGGRAEIEIAASPSFSLVKPIVNSLRAVEVQRRWIASQSSSYGARDRFHCCRANSGFVGLLLSTASLSADFRSGSFASFWHPPVNFRSTPRTGHGTNSQEFSHPATRGGSTGSSPTPETSPSWRSARS